MIFICPNVEIKYDEYPYVPFFLGGGGGGGGGVLKSLCNHNKKQACRPCQSI